MKTYQEFISELNKLELALKAGKVGLKTLKKIGLKSATKKVPVKDITKFRSNPKNPFTSQMRSAENKTVDHLKKIGKVQRDNLSPTDNPFFDVPKDFQFGHGKIYKLANGVKLVGCYHPSPRNVNTGRINIKKMVNLLNEVKKITLKY